jgi:hypothetical protein
VKAGEYQPTTTFQLAFFADARRRLAGVLAFYGNPKAKPPPIPTA